MQQHWLNLKEVGMASLEGKTVLVTGASSGIGESTARLLIDEGASVYAAARRVDRMRPLEEAGAHLVELDVTDEKSITEAVEKIERERGNIDILINAAGYGSYGAVEDVPIAEARNQFEVNLFGLARLTQLALPKMRQKRFGKIVNISSMGGRIYTPYGAWYHATKHALEGWSDCLRLELKSFGIDVIVVEPGGIKTEWGAIAAENLKRTSGSGVYGEKATKVANVTAKLYASDTLTHPDVVAKVILKSVKAGRPRARYVSGFGAAPAIFIRKWFGDRLFDRIAMTQM